MSKDKQEQLLHSENRRQASFAVQLTSLGSKLDLLLRSAVETQRLETNKELDCVGRDHVCRPMIT